MPDLRVYRTDILEEDQVDGRSRGSPENSLLGLLNQDAAAAERISSPPGELRLQAQVKGRYADLMAAELDELADSGGFAEIPVHAPGTRTRADGYYLASDREVAAVERREPLMQDVTLSLERAGTRDSHYRAVKTAPRTGMTALGTTSSGAPELWLPSSATDVRWHNPTTGDTEPASSSTTGRVLETGTVDGYALGDASFFAYNSGDPDPTLLYDAPYVDQGPTDVAVYDTRGHSSRDDANGYVQWQQAHVDLHDYSGDARALSTGRLRLTLDPSSDPGIQAETYSGSWSGVSTGFSSWELDAVDIGRRDDQRLGPVRVDAVTRWTDGTDEYRLDLVLTRGADRAEFYRAPSESGAIPADLVDLLAPITDSHDVTAQASQALVARSEVE